MFRELEGSTKILLHLVMKFDITETAPLFGFEQLNYWSSRFQSDDNPEIITTYIYLFQRGWLKIKISAGQSISLGGVEPIACNRYQKDFYK